MDDDAADERLEEMNKRLFEAIEWDNPDAIRQAIAAGADVEALNGAGLPPLYMAAFKASEESLAALLDAGARINRRHSEAHGSALNRLIRSQKFDEALYLLNRGADPRVTNDRHETALHFLVTAIAGAHSSNTLMENQRSAFALMDQILKIVPIDQTDSDGDTALMTAVAWDGPLATIGLLLHHGANPRLLNAQGRGPMHHKWETLNLPVLHTLIASGVNIDQRDARGNTALFHAATPEAIEAILDLGADIDAVNYLGQNALAFQVQTQIEAGKPNLGVIESLLQHGLSPETPDYSDASTLVYARDSGGVGQEEIYAALLAHQAKVTMTRTASRARALSK